MIGKIYETHVQVKDVEASIKFYQDKLGLELGHHSEGKAFFWVGDRGSQMLGVWQVPEDASIKLSHFAFEVELDYLMSSKQWLEERGVEGIGSQGKENIDRLSKCGCRQPVCTS